MTELTMTLISIIAGGIFSHAVYSAIEKNYRMKRLITDADLCWAVVGSYIVGVLLVCFIASPFVK